MKIPLTTKPTPGTNTTARRSSSTRFAGEQLTDNNTSTYTVVFRCDALDGLRPCLNGLLLIGAALA